MDIRPIFEHELEAVFPVVAELRTHLDREEFVYAVRRQAAMGYELWGAFEGRALVGAIGFRSAHTLARGAHLHVDDLVVTQSRRKSGIGRALLELAEKEARRHGFDSVFLDSRPEVLPFYYALGYAPHTATLLRKSLGGT
jgi:GNAT superfamily N-acetyltransferase